MSNSRVRTGTTRSFLWNGVAWSIIGDATDDTVRVIRKTANQTSTTNVLANENQLTLNIGANEQWIVQYNLNGNSQTNADWKFAVTAPAGATCAVSAYDPEGATAQ